MEDTVVDAVPEGFTELPSGLGFLDKLRPLYRLQSDSQGGFGLVVAEQHVNTMGMCHGGVLMTIADATAALGVNLARGQLIGNPTINLSLDFISAAKQGQWIEARAELVNLKRRFGFCSGVISNSAGIVARFNGTFYFPDHDGILKNAPDKATLLNPD